MALPHKVNLPQRVFDPAAQEKRHDFTKLPARAGQARNRHRRRPHPAGAMTAPAGARTVLYDTQELTAVIDEMARQANGLLHGASQVAVIGVLRRGAPLADRLTTRLMELYGLPQPLRLDLQVKRYADDLTLLHPQTQLTEQAQHAALDLRGYIVLVVDDVLYTGHSLLKVVEYLARKQPAAIRVACLVNRDTTCLPVHADVVGACLGVAPPDIIECHVPPYEPDFRIELVQPDRQNGPRPR